MPDPSALIPPPLTTARDVDAALAATGFAVLGAEGEQGLEGLAGVPLAALQAWHPFWDRLPPDAYLLDGGKYRQRRHGNFVVEGDTLVAAPHRPHWQSVDYNALHGGIERHFEPLEPALAQDPAWRRLLVALAARASALKGAQAWYVEAHTFRIDTANGIGRPTPEGAHRDGVDLVSVSLVERRGIKGGETRVFQAQSAAGQRFTMSRPWTTVLLDDARVIHETTPIQPAQAGERGWRDTLVLTFRAGGFQGPSQA
ncbi:MAG TPA: 2OG-Fe dioxygenase family protein [Burkholderiaceae bacterium]